LTTKGGKKRANPQQFDCTTDENHGTKKSPGPEKIRSWSRPGACDVFRKNQTPYREKGYKEGGLKSIRALGWGTG